MSKIKALVLFSGGLDSLLAVKTLEAQNIDVTAICFASNFFGAKKAKNIAEKNNIKLKIVDISEKILDLVKNPPSGYGKNLNPCVDCHSLMIREAGKIIKDEGLDFVATGEVLGQRPFSQNKEALEKVIKLSGVEVLRPLCAKLLPETEIEKKGLVNRGKLHSVHGRTREEQMALVKKYNIKEFESPAGGCLLTDPEFSKRLNITLEYWPECNINDIELLKYGRVFWFEYKNNGKNIKILTVVGRDANDNENLTRVAQTGDFVVELKEIPGPTTLIRDKERYLKNFENSIKINVPKELQLKDLKVDLGKSDKEIFQAAAFLTGIYTIKARNKEVEIIFKLK
jgi:tRNA-uridine 2-sulfurtransferase